MVSATEASTVSTSVSATSVTSETSSVASAAETTTSVPLSDEANAQCVIIIIVIIIIPIACGGFLIVCVCIIRYRVSRKGSNLPQQRRPRRRRRQSPAYRVRLAPIARGVSLPNVSRSRVPLYGSKNRSDKFSGQSGGRNQADDVVFCNQYVFSPQSTGCSNLPIRAHNCPQFYASPSHRPVASAYNNFGFVN